MKNEKRLKQYYDSLEITPMFSKLGSDNIDKLRNSDGFRMWNNERIFYNGLRWCGNAIIIGFVLIVIVVLFGNEILKHL